MQSPPAAAAERHVAHPRWTPSPNEAPARSKTEATSEARAGAWTGAKPPQSIADRSWSPPIDGHGLFKSLMLRLPRGVRRSFDHEQLLAIRQAAEEMAWGEHPIDIRLRLPWPGGRRYLVLLGGRDQRGPAKRLQRHTRIHAVRVGNLASGLVLLSVGLTATLLLGLALRTLLLG